MSKAKESIYQILIIEDDFIDKEIICRSLNTINLKYKVSHFDSIKLAESYDWIRGSTKFDLIFLDYNFPTGVSSNFLHIQKTILNTKIPIIILTGNESEILKKNFSKYENVVYLIKTEDNYNKIPSLVTELLHKKISTNS